MRKDECKCPRRKTRGFRRFTAPELKLSSGQTHHDIYFASERLGMQGQQGSMRHGEHLQGLNHDHQSSGFGFTPSKTYKAYKHRRCRRLNWKILFTEHLSCLTRPKAQEQEGLRLGKILMVCLLMSLRSMHLTEMSRHDHRGRSFGMPNCPPRRTNHQMWITSPRSRRQSTSIRSLFRSSCSSSSRNTRRSPRSDDCHGLRGWRMS